MVLDGAGIGRKICAGHGVKQPTILDILLFLFSVKIIGPTCKNEPRFYTQRGPANQRGPRGLPAMDRYPTTRAFSFLEKAIPLQFILFFCNL